MPRLKKWIPAIKEQWVVIATNVEPHVQTLTTKTVELYLVSKDAVIPQIIKAHELADPYLQVRFMAVYLGYLFMSSTS